MFGNDFYPTPKEKLPKILFGYNFTGTTILEPQAGKGNIVEYLYENGAEEVLTCEINHDLATIIQSKSRFIQHDFLELKSHQISHINFIIMNPPFSADEKHLIHAWNIAPPGCQIISLINFNTYRFGTNESRRILRSIIDDYGSCENIKDIFSDAERSTGVEIGLVKLNKPADSYEQEFDDFFFDQEPEEITGPGFLKYSAIKALVNRYVEAIKIFDEQLNSAVKLNQMIKTFYETKIGFQVTEDNKPKKRREFITDLQKSAWNHVIQLMNLEKFSTRGLESDLNRFVEKQSQVPFTEKNIYKMIELIIGTQEDRMDRAVKDVFERLTRHYHENRYQVEGWKTNSHYLFNHKFIMPFMTTRNWSGGMGLHYNGNYKLIDDLNKALCFITGTNYDTIGSLWYFMHNRYVVDEDGKREKESNGYTDKRYYYHYGTWYEWGFFEFKGYKKGTMHFKFKDLEVWGKLNQRISKIMGYPLFEKAA